MYEKITENIAIRAEPAYLDDQSSPDEGRYVWAYRIIIENRGNKVVRLKSRYWRITDAHGQTQEVSGEGVVGEQPILNPGQVFEYTSGTPLNTPGGFMTGNYTMEYEDGTSFTAFVPAFSLDSPYQNSAVH